MASTKISKLDIDTFIQYLKLYHYNLSKWARHDDPKAHHSKACIDCTIAHNYNWIEILEKTKYLDTLKK